MSGQEKSLSDKERHRLAHILISLFMSEYKRVHGRPLSINRYAAKWGMADVVDSVGEKRAGELIKYYFTVSNTHSIEYFYKNFINMDEAEKELRADRRRRARIMEATRLRVEEEQDQ